MQRLPYETTTTTTTTTTTDDNNINNNNNNNNNNRGNKNNKDNSNDNTFYLKVPFQKHKVAIQNKVVKQTISRPTAQLSWVLFI